MKGARLYRNIVSFILYYSRFRVWFGLCTLFQICRTVGTFIQSGVLFWQRWDVPILPFGRSTTSVNIVDRAHHRATEKWTRTDLRRPSVLKKWEMTREMGNVLGNELENLQTCLELALYVINWLISLILYFIESIEFMHLHMALQNCVGERNVVAI